MNDTNINCVGNHSQGLISEEGGVNRHYPHFLME